HREAGMSWRLQQKTDLSRDPELNFPTGPYIDGAPVGDDGNPVLYPLPASFAAAQNDGERYRRALADAGLAGDEHAALAWADFLDGEIGLSTLNYQDWADRTVLPGGEESIRALGDRETLARMVDGMHRFTLADDVNPLQIYQDFLTRHPDDLAALDRLAVFRSQRAQFDRAAELLERYRKLDANNDSVNLRYRQLTAPLLRFEPRGPFALGETMAVDFQFRNAKAVDFELQKVDFDALWQEWREAILRPRKDGEPELVENFAADAITMLNAKNGKPDRAWRRTLDPAPRHADRKGQAELPALESGFYLLTAKVENGNRAQMLFAVNGFGFWSQPAPGVSQFFVTDAVTGNPVEGARVTTYRLEQRYATTPEELAKYGGKVRSRWIEGSALSNGFGQAVIPVRDHGRDWTLVRSADGKTVAWSEQFLYPGANERENTRTAAYLIADRPIYRPGDTVELECYLRKIGYAVLDPEKDCAYRKLQVEIRSPRGTKVLDQSFTSTSFGSFAVSFATAPDAELGVYRVLVRDGHLTYGNAVFRVEEFVKPEYKVTLDTPAAPVKAGSAVECAIRADYYFGGPVADAAVKISVTRSAHYNAPFFYGPWRWLYGDWYWRCSTAWKFGGMPPGGQVRELVLRTEGKTDAGGKFKLRIDTATLAARYGESDAELRIEATVTDSARKPVNASASVIVAAKPFRVYAYTPGGFFAPGDTIDLKVAARTPDGKPVAGRGEVRICRQVLENGLVKRQEPALRTLELVADGKSDFTTVPFAIAESGVYAVESTLTAADGSRASFTLPVRVVGEKLPNEGIFSELPLEISTDKIEYRVGDQAKLLFNSRFAAGTFFVFIRNGGAASDFRVLHFNGHAEMLTLAIDRDKQPNFFVDAVLVSGGKLYRESKEIVVPPEKKILKLAVEVPAPQVRPGTPGEIRLKVCDAEGNPVKGSVTVTVYDAALDAVPGAIPVPDILRFFWGWKRYGGNLPVATNLDDNAFLFSSEPVEALFPPLLGGQMILGYNMAGGNRNLRMKFTRSAALPQAAMGLDAVSAAPAFAGSADKAEVADAEIPADLPVRTDFADRILWVARKTLEADGTVKLNLRYPDNLTTWAVKVWAFADDLRVGEGETSVIASKEMIARLTLPRFLVEGDQTVVTATIHNYAAEPRNCKVTLKVPENVTILASPKNEIAIPPQGKAVLEWKVAAGPPGKAEFTLAAVAGEGGDALRETIEILPRGALQMNGMSGILDGDRAEENFEIPSSVRLGSVRLTVNVAPSSALAMLELLPYLAGEESNNVFSTVARFAPALAARDALLKSKVPAELFGKYRGHFAELAGGRDRAELWSEYCRNPLADSTELNRVALKNVRMLEGTRNADGGWGWFSSRSEMSSRDTTVEAVNALLQAQSSGLAVNPAVLRQA
ncbi:MAG: MG2 domain-containing protein, partial [Victivallaceae bacterium]